MTRLTRVADAMLRIAVPHEEAGACVPTVGNRCRLGTQTKCSGHTRYQRAVYGEVSCTGPCSRSNVSYGKYVANGCC